jgi:hypothetical protein
MSSKASICQALKTLAMRTAAMLLSILHKLKNYRNVWKSRDNSVGIALCYGLDDWGSRVRFPAGARNFSLHHRVQNASGAYPTSYPMGITDSFPGGKEAGA